MLIHMTIKSRHSSHLILKHFRRIFKQIPIILTGESLGKIGFLQSLKLRCNNNDYYLAKIDCLTALIYKSRSH